MADIYKSSSNLKILWEFADGDTRTTTIKNPRYGLTSNELQAFAATAVSNQVIIGDKGSAQLTGIKSAYTEDKTDVILDIGA